MSRFQSILLRTWVPSLGENEEQVGHKPKGGLSLLVRVAFHSEFYDLLCQTYGSRMLSRPLLSLSFPWRQYDLHLKSVYEVGRVSEDESSLCIYKTRGLSFLSIVAFRYFAERAERPSWLWAFSFMNTGHQEEPLGRQWAFHDRRLISFHQVS